MLLLSLPVAFAFTPATDTTLVGGPNDGVGWELASGDFDGDGYDEVVSNRDASCVFAGSPSGILPGAIWCGGGMGGIAVLDANGDGYDDLVVSDYMSGVRLYLGSSLGLGAAPSWTYALEMWAVLAVGDLNADGRQDLVYLDPENSAINHDGRVRVFPGTPQGLAAQPASDWRDNSAQSVAVSDLDGDGFDDLAVGTPYVNQLSGAIEVHRGSAQGADPNVTWRVNPPPLVLEFGMVLAGGGDLDGDGFGDLATSARGGDEFAIVYGRANGPNGSTRVNVAPGGYVGLAIVADVNGDGRDEVSASWPEATVQGDTKRGGAGLFLSGTRVPTAAPFRVMGDVRGDRAGAATTGGDFDGDGRTDWAIAAVGAGPDGEIGVFYDP